MDHRRRRIDGQRRCDMNWRCCAMTSGALGLGIGKTGAPINLIKCVKHKRTAHSSVQILRVRFTNTTAELNVKSIWKDLECKSNERRKGRDKQSEENGNGRVEKLFFL